jgi:hypothetical protein
MFYDFVITFYGSKTDGFPALPGAADICNSDYTLMHIAGITGVRGYTLFTLRYNSTSALGIVVSETDENTDKMNMLSTMCGIGLLYRSYNVIRTFGTY